MWWRRRKKNFVVTELFFSVFLPDLSVRKVLLLNVGPCIFYDIELMCWKLAVGQCGFWKMPTGVAGGDGGDRFFVRLQSWRERRREKTQSPPTICILILFSCRRAPKPYACKSHSQLQFVFQWLCNLHLSGRYLFSEFELFHNWICCHIEEQA